MEVDVEVWSLAPGTLNLAGRENSGGWGEAEKRG